MWRSAGFLRCLVDGAEHRLDSRLPRLKKTSRVDLVLDRLSFSARSRSRIAEAVEQAEAINGGRVSVLVQGGARTEFSTRGACPRCGFLLEGELGPRHFSFNTHTGACPECDGLGVHLRCRGELLVTRPERSLVDGAIEGKFGRYLTKGKGYYEHLLRTVAEVHGVDLTVPFESLGARRRDLLLHGTGARPEYGVELAKSYRHADVEERFTAPWPGLCGHIDGWHARTTDPEWAAMLEGVMQESSCASCGGERLRAEARAVTVGRRRLPEVLRSSVSESLAWLGGVRLPAATREAVEPVLAELGSRLSLLDRVGLGYLTLDRATSTLSGGEARRVRLSASLGSKLVGVCYVLDEPTVGLHPGDVDRLCDALLALRDGGNTVVVVEHDEHLMSRADCIVDLGPGAGRLGGKVVACGTPEEIRRHPRSLTGAALRGELELRRAPRAPAARGESLVLRGARLHNLRGVSLEARFGEITGVCGPSGSGKSTLVLDTLVPALRGEPADGRWKRLTGAPGGSLRTVVVDASPLGRTPASVPATHTGLMEPLRELFARTPDARQRGLTASHFSFNSTRGRCPACDGRGATRVEMQFLADLWLTCEECGGRRYAPEVGQVRYRGRSIADVLDMSVDEALEFLAQQPPIASILRTLADVGLGYLSLGQSSTTLSGGEAQRVKLATELRGASNAPRSVLILDEPTTGLHAADVSQLAGVLVRLAESGHAVILIEHHTGLLSICDRLVELGPGGGQAGGRIIARGTPAELATDPASVTGPWLRGRGRDRRRARGSAREGTMAVGGRRRGRA